ncbi:trimeric intracellular cation channel family protein [Ferrimonas futtsuensis]|uniref:trimeric intracellular cation channel family protein n=1 Tax=Ferrimonas futtsuensis TaxID=364764 RepID=UPI000425BA94|nr:trimeric intracellular cation channel family protein [Ferrimonas futtsuensis]
MTEMQLILVLWLVGVLTEAITGALAAGRNRMDLFGVVMVACVTAIGGGTVRDVLLGGYPLIWVAHPEYLVAIAITALLTVACAPVMRYLTRLFLTLDALGLAVFSIIGVQKALSLGHTPVIAIASGLITGIFGGILRDLFCQRVPLVFQKELYALVSLVTAALYMGLTLAELSEWVKLAVCLPLGFGLRLLAIRLHWSVPTFDYQEQTAH